MRTIGALHDQGVSDKIFYQEKKALKFLEYLKFDFVRF